MARILAVALGLLFAAAVCADNLLYATDGKQLFTIHADVSTGP